MTLGMWPGQVAQQSLTTLLLLLQGDGSPELRCEVLQVLPRLVGRFGCILK